MQSDILKTIHCSVP